MYTGFKMLVLFPLLGTIVGVAYLREPPGEQAISVLLRTVGEKVSSHEKTKIFLKATFNGKGVRHGEVKMDISPARIKASGSAVDFKHRVEGYTDAHGIFIPHWVPSAAGEYLVTAIVAKGGYIPGKSACVLSVAK